MRVKHILPMLILSVATLSFSLGYAEAANVDVNISGFLPAPPGVIVQVDSGRPYYVERDRRVYMEREPRYYKDKDKHYKKEKKHHKDHGNKHGHDRY